jgi:hypothetical protein
MAGTAGLNLHKTKKLLSSFGINYELISGDRGEDHCVLRLVISEGGTGLQSKKVTQTIGRTPATTKKALTALESQEILRQQEPLGQVRYRFEDPFFAAWIKAFIPPLEQKP